MTPIPVPIHPNLEVILGYTNNQQTIALSWNPNTNILEIHDGNQVQVGNYWAFLIWIGHPSVRPHLVGIPEDCILVFDRKTRTLSAANQAEAVAALAGNSVLDNPTAAGSWMDAQWMLAGFMGWMDGKNREVTA